MITRLVSGFVLIALLSLLAGCGRGWGEVSGTVRYKSKPLPKGSITFYDETNQALTSPIDADGKYTMPKKVAAGKVKVTIALPMYVPMRGDEKAAAKMRAEQRKLPNLPDRYGDAEKSGLDRDVKAGSQKIDFDLD